MSFNSASPRMKRGPASRSGQGRGRIKPSSSGPPQSQSLEGLYTNDRLVNAVTSVVGCGAKITAKNGKQFEGVFKTISPEACLVLGKANQVDEQRQNGVVDAVVQKSEIFEQFVIPKKNWVMAEFKNVNLEECYYKKDSFKTDSAIGSNKKLNGQPPRELEKWIPSEHGASLDTHSLEEQSCTQINGWRAEDMFNVNERKYGVKSTYNEDMEEYTTKLEKSDTPEYREKEKIAMQKAEEIFKESPYECNTFDSGRSEEQLYSAVVRTNKHDRSAALNWRQPLSERPVEREQRTPKLIHDNSTSPVPGRKESARNQQPSEPPTSQVKEKVEKPATETPLEHKTEKKAEAFSDVVKVETKPVQSPTPAKTPIIPTNTPVTLATTQVSTEKPEEPTSTSETTVATPKSKTKEEDIDDLKTFSVNFQLANQKETKKKNKPKKVAEEDEKMSNEVTNAKEEKEAPAKEVKTETESSADKKTKSELNPNAQEFRPRVKRNTPSPRSNSATPSSGAASPFQSNAPYPYPPNNVYSRNGPRGRGGIRPEYIDPSGTFVNATNAAGQPFFARHMSAPFIPQPSPQSYVQPAGLRHPGIQHPMFLQPGHQPMMVPVGPAHYPDYAIYYDGAIPMIQSPPHITSPSVQQSQFNFPSPTIPQNVNALRSVPQASVMAQQQPPQLFLVRPSPPATSEIQPTQIMTNRGAPQAQSFQGN